MLNPVRNIEVGDLLWKYIWILYAICDITILSKRLWYFTGKRCFFTIWAWWWKWKDDCLLSIWAMILQWTMERKLINEMILGGQRLGWHLGHTTQFTNSTNFRTRGIYLILDPRLKKNGTKLQEQAMHRIKIVLKPNSQFDCYHCFEGDTLSMRFSLKHVHNFFPGPSACCTDKWSN